MPRSAKVQNLLLRYGLAFAAAAIMTAFAVVLPRLLNTKASPFVIFAYVIAVLVSGWWGGYGPGLLAALLMNFVSPYFLTSSWDPRRVEIIRLTMTIGLSLFVSYIASRRDHDEAMLRASNEELERRVQERTAELRLSNQRLQQTNEELERFAYIASHDLQEPLRTMSIYAQLLGRQYRGKLGEEADQMLDFIRGGSARMQELVAAIMEFSRSPAHSPEFADVHVSSVLAVAKANLSSAIDEQQASIVAEELPVVYCDPTHLARVFQNLISNALALPQHRTSYDKDCRRSRCQRMEILGRGQRDRHRSPIQRPDLPLICATACLDENPWRRHRTGRLQADHRAPRR